MGDIKEITHERLLKSIKGLVEEEETLSVVLRADNDKANIYLGNKVNAHEYQNLNTIEEKLTYLTKQLAVKQSDIILPITIKAVNLVSHAVSTKTIEAVEEEMYRMVRLVNNNYTNVVDKTNTFNLHSYF